MSQIQSLTEIIFCCDYFQIKVCLDQKWQHFFVRSESNRICTIFTCATLDVICLHEIKDETHGGPWNQQTLSKYIFQIIFFKHFVLNIHSFGVPNRNWPFYYIKLIWQLFCVTLMLHWKDKQGFGNPCCCICTRIYVYCTSH